MHDALSPSLILVLMCCVLLSPLLQLESIQEQLDGLHEQLNTLSGRDHMQERSVYLCTCRLYAANNTLCSIYTHTLLLTHSTCIMMYMPCSYVYVVTSKGD